MNDKGRFVTLHLHTMKQKKKEKQCTLEIFIILVRSFCAHVAIRAEVEIYNTGFILFIYISLHTDGNY